MYSTTMRVACAVGFLLLAFSGFSQKTSQTTDKVLFSVDNQPVYTSEFLYLYNKNNKGKPEEKSEGKIREYLDLVIAFKLKVAEAHQRGVDTTQAFIHEFTTYRDELKKPHVASQDDLGRLVKEAYERMKEEIKASHILVKLSPDASPKDTLAAWQKIMSIRERAVNGENFGTLAKQFSDDPSAKQNEGNLGYFTVMSMVYQFEDGAYKTKVGEISQPVRTRFGYHIIKVNDRRPASKVEVSHIFLAGADDKTKNKAFEVYDQLKGGRSWDEVCKEYSDDTNTKDRGGKLPAIGVGDFPAVPEFEETALSMQNPGDLSDPFKSQVGWHIIRFEKRLPVPSFADAEPMLKRRIGRDERLQVTHAAQLAKRKAELNLVENTAVKSALESKADTSLQKGHWKVTTANDAETLFTINSKAVSVGDFLKYVRTHQRQSALAPTAYFRQLYDQFTEVYLNDAEDEKLQATNADYRNLSREYKEGIMFFSIMEKEVWNKGSADTAGQRAYYEAHKKKYEAGDRVSARIYSSPDKAFMKDVVEKTRKGDTLSAAEAKKFKSVTSFRAYGKGENKIVDMTSWTTGIHEVEADGMYYLVEIERLLPPGIKSFQEARANVISDYQEEIEKKWLESLKAKHKVTLNRKAVKQVIQQLEKQ